jgi:hypothetical protein
LVTPHLVITPKSIFEHLPHAIIKRNRNFIARFESLLHRFPTELDNTSKIHDPVHEVSLFHHHVPSSHANRCGTRLWLLPVSLPREILAWASLRPEYLIFHQTIQIPQLS